MKYDICALRAKELLVCHFQFHGPFFCLQDKGAGMCCSQWLKENWWGPEASLKDLLNSLLFSARAGNGNCKNGTNFVTYKLQFRETIQAMHCNVTLRHIRATIVAEEKQ